MNRYGLIGKQISYSFSKKLHEAIGNQFNIRLSYDILDCDTELDVINKIQELRQQKYQGYNVTIPYKEFIMRYCDELTPEAQSIGAVNTIYLEDGKVIGDNTDYYGFIKLLNLYHILPKGQVSYVLGSGGAAKAVTYALKTLGAKSVVVSRDKESIKDKFELVTGYDTLDIITKIDILINTTPIGTYPKTDQMPVSRKVAHKTNVAIDLIYNPKETLLMKEVSFGIGGIYMLIGQALKAESIWQRRPLDESKETFDILMEAIS